MSVQVSYKKQFLVMLLLFLVLIIVVEITARTYDFLNPGCGFIGNDVFDHTNWYTTYWICVDPYLIDWDYSEIRRYIPNQNHNTININSHGFRGFEFSEQKFDDTYRIFVVGGSTVFGYGSTSDKTSIPGYLQNEFDKLDLNKKVEVINAGIGFATSFEEEYLIKKKLMQYDPDLIVIFDGGNDVYTKNKEIILDHGNPVKNPFQIGTYDFYLTPIVIYKNIVKPFNSQLKIDDVLDDTNSYDYVTNNWESNIKKICKLGKNNNFKVAIFLQPLLISTEKTLSFDEKEMKYKELESNKGQINKQLLSKFSHSIQSFTDECHISADLTNIFDKKSEAIFYDWIHVSDNGNGIIAENIYQKIIPLVLEDISK